ncbi:NADH-quinone oxidoreductase subunit NuoE [Rhizobium sp. KVB221]|uniref:NADH-quinone oxidoreductase subunit NuoE n=1 Tax=Rhizobium setariae TaxID=2801340 RepID=A0A936YRE2_9HYPH|nr:NADH-quinone oxidoreductase subunit NuoE [Rhizobium setariae]MBL0372829.1 NADH-quinone oxidoreductase subunit NuoE [Rhizobium setariae]
MSVRRLAEDSVQPASFAFSKDNAVWAKATIKKYPKGREQSAVIPLLMRAQEQDGWVTKAAIESIADMLGMAYIRVLEVATFYTQFQLQPVGTRAHIQVCGTTPCMLRGAEDLISVCKSKIHAQPHHLNADGTLSWEEVECLGACVNAPMVAIFKDTFEDLTPRQLEYVIERFEAGRASEVKPGPQIDRVFSAPIGGLTTLTTPDPKPKVARTKSAAAEEVAAVAPTDSAKPSLDDPNRPAGIEKPSQPDDLKMISGVGPKIEGILNELGIYTFAQVAGWKQAERDWVDGYLNFKGRIDRDDWVKQADALAKGGEAEYIKVFGKKPR